MKMTKWQNDWRIFFFFFNLKNTKNQENEALNQKLLVMCFVLKLFFTLIVREKFFLKLTKIWENEALNQKLLLEFFVLKLFFTLNMTKKKFKIFFLIHVDELEIFCKNDHNFIKNEPIFISLTFASACIPSGWPNNDYFFQRCTAPKKIIRFLKYLRF